MISLTVSSFEIVHNSDQPRSSSEQPSLSGYVRVENISSKSFQMLEELCSAGAVAEVVIVYRDYAFSLIEVTFSESNAQFPGTTCSFKFDARDIHLAGLLGS